MSVSAPITNISRGSLHDGRGIRTVVYFAGCQLRCAWCHNPETYTAARKILYAPIKCIKCGRCIEICPAQHKIVGDDMIFYRDGCTSCARCADVCPSEALSVCGTQMSLDEVLAEVEKDRRYYNISGGGVTLSGGECLLHSEFCRSLLSACTERKIHTTIETALFVPREAIDRVLPYTNAFFADLKLADPIKHLAFVGQDNVKIIDNLRYLAEVAPKGSIVVRIPLIPTVNDDRAELESLAGIIASLADGVGEVELLRYNPLAESKYQIAGMKYHAFGDRAQRDDEMKRAVGIVRERLPERISVKFR